MLPTLAFIGAGRIAAALAVRLHEVGYPIIGITSRRHESAQVLADRIGAKAAVTPFAADLIFIAVSDDALAEVVHRLAKEPPQGAVAHTSGVHSLEVLAALTPRPVGSFHPMYPFREGTRLQGSEGMLVGIEATTPQLADQLFAIARAIGGQPVLLKTGEKVRYHAAAAIASNYLVTLFDASLTLMTQAGVPQADARRALLKLMQGNLDNLSQLSPAQALTGPIARGDQITIEQHLTALQNTPYAGLYRELGRLTVQIAPNLDPSKRAALLKTLT